MKYLSANDGIDHINVYSKGKTELGRLLSNFAHTPFKIDWGDTSYSSFQSVEGYWYYLLTGDEKLCGLYGFQAKQYGKSQWNKKAEPVTKEELKIAYLAKLEYHPNIEKMLLENELPLKHYYIFNGKIVIPKQFQWTVKLWEEIKQERQ